MIVRGRIGYRIYNIRKIKYITNNMLLIEWDYMSGRFSNELYVLFQTFEQPVYYHIHYTFYVTEEISLFTSASTLLELIKLCT